MRNSLREFDRLERRIDSAKERVVEAARKVVGFEKIEKDLAPLEDAVWKLLQAEQEQEDYLKKQEGAGQK